MDQKKILTIPLFVFCKFICIWHGLFYKHQQKKQLFLLNNDFMHPAELISFSFIAPF